MKTPSKNFTWSFHLKINIFRFSKLLSFSKILFFLKICFLHDEIIFFVRIFFCDQVCISSNLRNHLEHSQCSPEDSGRPTKTRFLVKITKIHQTQRLCLEAPVNNMVNTCSRHRLLSRVVGYNILEINPEMSPDARTSFWSILEP